MGNTSEARMRFRGTPDLSTRQIPLPELPPEKQPAPLKLVSRQFLSQGVNTPPPSTRTALHPEDPAQGWIDVALSAGLKYSPSHERTTLGRALCDHHHNHLSPNSAVEILRSGRHIEHSAPVALNKPVRIIYTTSPLPRPTGNYFSHQFAFQIVVA